MTRAHEVSTRWYAFLSIVASAVFLLIIGVVTLGQQAFSFAYGRTYLLPAWGTGLIAAALLTILAWARRLFPVRASRPARWTRFLIFYFSGLLVLMFFITRSRWFYPDWDMGMVLQTAEQLVKGEAIDQSYFVLCPNNSVITLLLTIPLWVASKLSLAVPYAVLPYLSMLLVCLACLVSVMCVTKLTVSRLARLSSLFFCTVWILLSRTVIVPYTDTFSILFPILALYIYLSDMRNFPKWLLIALLCSFGAAVKPTVAIFMIALVLISALRLFPLSGMNRKRWKRTAVILAALVIGMVPGRLLYYGANLYITGEAQPQKQLCDSHYLMMGMNDETYGGHSPEDVEFSTSFSTLAERRAANLHATWQRIAARGVAGNLRFFAIKLYKAYSDGTLAANSSYLIKDMPARTDAFSVWVREFDDRESAQGVLAATMEQGVWLTMLMLCAALFLGWRRRRALTAVLAVTLVGVTVYLLLFEVWPRYLFLYAPLFVLAASLGLEQLRLPTSHVKGTTGVKVCA